MPKGRKKKQRRPQIPALSRGDKAIYNVLMALCLPVSLAALFLWRTRQVRLLSQDALAMSETAVGGFVLFAFLFAHVGIFAELKQNKVHLFGRRDITYGPPKWREAYPILRPHPKVHRKPEEQRRLRRNWIAYLACWLAVVLIAWGAVYPRKVWETDGGVTVYGWRNRAVRVVEPEELVQVCFETDSIMISRNHWTAGLQIRLTTAEGETYLFDQRDQSSSCRTREEWLTRLVQLKDALPPGVAANMINLDYDLEDVIRDNDYTPAEAALLYRLFSE